MRMQLPKDLIDFLAIYEFVYIAKAYWEKGKTPPGCETQLISI